MSQRLPYNEWLQSLSKEELLAYLERKNAREASRGQTRAPRRTTPRQYNSRAQTYAPRATSTRSVPRTRRPRKEAASEPPGWTSAIGTSLGTIAGGFLGGPAGAALGGTLGKAMGDGLGTIISGFGEYRVQQNSLLHTVNWGQSPPRVMNTSKGQAFIVQHREFIGNMYSGELVPATSASSFTYETQSINPGNPEIFPWLAAVASQFQQWELRGMLVELKTTSSNTSATLSQGTMFMSAEYNVLADEPTNKRELENMEFADSCKPSESLIMPIECARDQTVSTKLYIAPDLNYNGGDPRLYDICKIYYGSEGVPAAGAAIAEVWVSYEVALYKPKILELGFLVQSYHSHFSGATALLPLGANQVVLPGSTDLVRVDGSTVYFPIGSATWLLLVHWTGQLAGVLVPGTTTTNCSAVDSWADNIGGDQTSARAPLGLSGGQSTSMMRAIFVNVPPGGTLDTIPSVTFGTLGVVPASVCYGDIVVTEVSHG